jgi:hypothetical protein
MKTVVVFEATERIDGVTTADHPGFEVRFESVEDGEIEIVVVDRLGMENRSRAVSPDEIVDALRRLDPDGAP